MTISTVDTSSGPYVGNGIADTFEYDFKIFDKTQLTVLQTDTDGVTTTLAVDSDYTVTNVGEDDGGDIVLSAPLVADYQLFIRANIPVTQETDFESQGGFFPDVHEDAFDKLTLLIQQNAASLARAVRLSEDLPLDGDFVIAEDVDGRRNKVLRFDNNGDVELVEFGSIEGLQNFRIQTVAVTAGVTEVTVPFTYLPNTNTIWVTVNGAYVPRSAYSELPGKIVFDNALSAGEVTFFGVSTAPVGTADAANVSYRETSTVEEALDGALQTVDTLAELPAAADNSGRVMYVDSIGILKSNGTNWRPTIIIRPEMFGAIGDGATDDSDALIDTFSFASAVKGCVELGAKQYLYTKPLGNYTSPFAIRGQGLMLSWLKATPEMTGDTLSFAETGFVVSGTWGANGDTIDYDSEVTGVNLQDFCVVGDQSLGSPQRGIMFYGRNDNVAVANVWVLHCDGTGVGIGRSDGSYVTNYMRESSFYNVQTRWCGTASEPAFHITTSSSTGGDSTNQVQLFGCRNVFQNDGAEGFVIESDRTDSQIRRISAHGLMSHGKEAGGTTGDLIVVRGAVSNCLITDPRTNSAEGWGITIDELNGEHPYGIDIQSWSQTTGDNGLRILAGRAHRVTARDARADTTSIKVGPSITGVVEIDLCGDAAYATLDVDASVRKWVNKKSSSRNDLPFKSERYVVGEQNDPVYVGYTNGDPNGVSGKEGAAGTILLNRLGTAERSSDAAWLKRGGVGNTGYYPVQLVLGGSTANRPSTPTSDQMYIDRTLGKPIWYINGAWVDATGTTV